MNELRLLGSLNSNEVDHLTLMIVISCYTDVGQQMLTPLQLLLCEIELKHAWIHGPLIIAKGYKEADHCNRHGKAYLDG